MARADYDAVCTSTRLADGCLWAIPSTLGLPRPPGGAGARAGNQGHAGAARSRGRDARRPLCRRSLAAKSPHRGRGGVWHDELGASGRGLSLGLDALTLCRGEGWEASSHPRTVISGRRASPRLSCRRSFYAWAGAGWWRFRAAISYTGRTRSWLGGPPKPSEANLLSHPVGELTKPGDVNRYTRVRCYQALLSRSCRWPCARLVRTRQSGRPSSAKLWVYAFHRWPRSCRSQQ
jgi:hypothetical protein